MKEIFDIFMQGYHLFGENLIFMSAGAVVAILFLVFFWLIIFLISKLFNIDYMVKDNFLWCMGVVLLGAVVYPPALSIIGFAVIGAPNYMFVIYFVGLVFWGFSVFHLLYRRGFDIYEVQDYMRSFGIWLPFYALVSASWLIGAKDKQMLGMIITSVVFISLVSRYKEERALDNVSFKY